MFDQDVAAPDQVARVTGRWPSVQGVGLHTGEQIGLRAFKSATRQTGLHLERLATGKKINRPSDDPPGFVAITEIDVRQKVITKRRDRIAFEQSYLGALDGAKSVVADLLIDLKGVVLAGSNKGGLTTEERDALQLDADSILATINALSNTSEFNGQKLLAGINTDELDLSGLFSGGKYRIKGDSLEDAAKLVDSAIARINSERGAAGNRAKELESEDRTLATELEAITGVRSTIEDADYAAETAGLVRSQMLTQAATFVTQFSRNLKAQTLMTLLNGVKTP